MTSISDELGVTRRNVSALVDALEEEGLVRRKPHPTDWRATVIEITGESAQNMDRVYDKHQTEVAGLFHKLAEEAAKMRSPLLNSLARLL